MPLVLNPNAFCARLVQGMPKIILGMHSIEFPHLDPHKDD